MRSEDKLIHCYKFICEYTRVETSRALLILIIPFNDFAITIFYKPISLLLYMNRLKILFLCIAMRVMYSPTEAVAGYVPRIG